MHSRRIAIAATLTIAASPLLSQPIAIDDPDFGPGSVTFDPSQNLEFLDLTSTLNIPVATIEAGLLPGGTYDGWRYATPEEVTNLLNEIGWSPPISSVFDGLNESPTNIALHVINEFIGATDPLSSGIAVSLGIFGDERVSEVLYIGPSIGGPVSSVSELPIPITDLLASTGHWLVRKVEDDAPTYQGHLTEQGTPFSGTADFRVTLVRGTALPLETIELTGVPVQDGLFTIPLSFDARALGSIDVSLQIEVRAPSGVGAYEMIGPNQPVTPAPRALRAGNADSADFADTAATALTLSNEATVPLPLAAGTEPYGVTYRSPVVSRSGNQVILNGLIRDVGISNAEGTVFATLPVGFRPTARLLFLQASSAGVYRVDVLPNGQLQFLGPPGVGGAIDWVSLDGIAFTLD